MLQTMSETVIVAALRRGNFRRAVELILDNYQEEVYGYCATLVPDLQSSSVYQQVLMLALEELPLFNGVVSIRAWLYGIARRVVLHRQLRAQRDFSSHSSASGPVLAFPRWDGDAAGLRPTDVELDACLDHLSPVSREVLQLSLWHGLLLSEVAHVTCRSLVEVRQLVAAGLTTLAGVLRRQGGTPS